ncbi:MAG TPA: NrsF family protein [Steroidobacteraceae bacterium]
MRYVEPPSEASHPALPPERLYQQIRARIAESPAPRVRTNTRAFWAITATLLVAVMTVMIASELTYQRQAVGLAVDADRSIRLAWTLGLLASVALASTSFAMRRGSSGFGIRAGPLAIATAIVVPLYAALTLIDPIHINEANLTGVAISPWGTRCATIAGIVGFTVLASFALALRRAVPVASRVRGAALGAAAAAWAGLAIFVFCPSEDQQHLVVGHVLPVLGLVLIGLVATPRFLRP